MQARKDGASEFEEISDQFVILSGAEIVALSGQYIAQADG